MGNRAVIQFTDTPIGIYLHWNGGRNSVEAFLQGAREMGIRGQDTSYRLARFTQLVGNFFGGTYSLGIGLVEHLDTDNYDNGVYLVDNEMQIIDRYHFTGIEQQDPPAKDILEQVIENNREHFSQETQQ